MDNNFSRIEEMINEISRINPASSYTKLEKYNALFWQIYENLIELEEAGAITIEPNKKHISYLQDILDNDGPEFAYSIIFWPKWKPHNQYEIGVCVRGLPIVKKL